MIATALNDLTPTLLGAVSTAWAAAPDDATTVTTGGALDWLKGNAVPILVLVVGLGLLLKGNKGDHSAVLLRTGLTVVALGVIAIALDNTLQIGIGKWLIGLIGVKAGA